MYPYQTKTFVIPAKAGIQSPGRRRLRPWVPAFAGMTSKPSVTSGDFLSEADPKCCRPKNATFSG